MSEIVEKVEAEVKKVEGETVVVVEEVKAEAQKIVKKTKVEITTDEKLFLRDAETEFLRAQMDIKDAQAKIQSFAQRAEMASKVYTARLNELVKKYAINGTEQMFDNIENCFKAIQKNI